ncbi:hypothetical protein ACEWY4_019862 [Coilia grayii]|uniref:Uncharacterized protein n=1 Tax=Coilia grayii TaxID=363190 RepID=A0ABD1JB89_9TELE
MSTNSVPLGNGFVVVTHVYREPDAPQGGAAPNEAALPPAPTWLQNAPLRAPPPQNEGLIGVLCLTEKFVKREQTRLGTVQALIGVIMFMFGIVTVINPHTVSARSGIMFWGSLSHIIAGCLTAVDSRNPSLCLDKKMLIMNILSSTTAGVAIVLHCVDFSVRNYYYDTVTVNGISGVMFVLSLVEFMISAAIPCFTYKAIYSTPEMLNNISSREAQHLPPSYSAATTVNTSETKFFPSAIAPPSSLSGVDKPEDLPSTV